MKKVIAICINDLAVAGAQQQLVRQLQLMNKDKYEFHVVLLLPDIGRSKLLLQLPEVVAVHQLAIKNLLDIRGVIALYKSLKRINPDIIVSSFFLSNTLTRIVNILLQRKIIIREHNTYVNKRWWQIVADRLLAYSTNVIVAVSDEVADFASKQAGIPFEKFEVIPNGISIAELKARSSSVDKALVRNHIGITLGQSVLLHVGRLVPQKNQKLLLKSFAEFYKNNKSWRLVIVGDGPLREELCEFAKSLKISETVYFLGEMSDVHPYYVIADAFITTSYIEGMSNTHLEAIAHGVPVVSTKTGGTNHTIVEGETGFLIRDFTVSAVIKALELLVAADVMMMRENIYQRQRQYDIATTVTLYENLFDRLD